MPAFIHRLMASVLRLFRGKPEGEQQKVSPVCSVLLDVPACRSIKLAVTASKEHVAAVEACYFAYSQQLPLLPFHAVETWFRQVLALGGETQLAADQSIRVEMIPYPEDKPYHHPGLLPELIALTRRIETRPEVARETQFHLDLGRLRRNLNDLKTLDLGSGEQLQLCQLKHCLEKGKAFQNLQPWLIFTNKLIRQKWST